MIFLTWFGRASSRPLGGWGTFSKAFGFSAKINGNGSLREVRWWLKQKVNHEICCCSKSHSRCRLLLQSTKWPRRRNKRRCTTIALRFPRSRLIDRPKEETDFRCVVLQHSKREKSYFVTLVVVDPLAVKCATFDSMFAAFASSFFAEIIFFSHENIKWLWNGCLRFTWNSLRFRKMAKYWEEFARDKIFIFH